MGQRKGVEPMDKKERYFAAVARREVDRIPTSFRASRVFARRLMAYLNIDPAGGLQSARATLAQIGADFWLPGSRICNYATFFPRYVGPCPQLPHVEDGSQFYTLGIPAVRGAVDDFGFEYPAFVDPPLASAERPTDIPPGYLTARLDLFDFECMINKLAPVAANVGGASVERLTRTNEASAPPTSDPLSYEGLQAAGQDVICIGVLNNFFMICCYLRGMEQFLLDLAWNCPLAERLIGETGEFCLEFSRRQLASFGRRAECYCGWDDVAGQQGILFSPELFRRYFQPLYRQLIDEVKRYDLIFSWHCCGSVHGVLPAMIDAGIDVFDVVQTSARDMDLGTVYKRYGHSVSLHGAVDVQKLLVFGTPDLVRAEIARANDLWGTSGGIILGPSHEIVPETPITNVLAIYDHGG